MSMGKRVPLPKEIKDYLDFTSMRPYSRTTMISKGKVMSSILIFTILKEFLKPFLINRVQGERTRTRKIDMELGNYLD